MMIRRTIRLSTSLLALTVLAQPARGQTAPTSTYWAYVGAESADLVHVVKYGPNGAELDKTIPVGEMQIETEGPHGVRLSPDKKFWYMTTGHGVPDGKLWKYEIGSDTLVAAPILLGFFPATVDITPDGLYAFIANFNLHGEMIPSTISVVYTPTLTEVTQTETCTMPHGARINAAGNRLYTACMMDDQLVEIDTYTFEVARRFNVATGHEGPLGAMADHDGMMMEHAGNTCGPTWAQPTGDGSAVFVACNKSNEILEISTRDWSLTRKLTAGRGPYNLALTPDGRTLIATLKQSGQVEFFDVARGTSRGTVQSTTTVTHGVDVTPDSRYAFVSVEGVGAEPGKVDIIDIQTVRVVGSVEVGQQAGGIAFWKMQSAN